eukprot:5939562-Amphidinium_carterae.2
MSQQSNSWQRKDPRSSMRVDNPVETILIPYTVYDTHQGQGSVERFHQTLFSQVRAIRFDLVDRCNLGGPDNVPEALLPWILQHACFNQQVPGTQ